MRIWEYKSHIKNEFILSYLFMYDSEIKFVDKISTMIFIFICQIFMYPFKNIRY